MLVCRQLEKMARNCLILCVIVQRLEAKSPLVKHSATSQEHTSQLASRVLMHSVPGRFNSPALGPSLDISDAVRLITLQNNGVSFIHKVFESNTKLSNA